MTEETKKAYATFSVSGGNSLVAKAISSQSTAITAVKSAMYFGIGVLIQHGNGKPLTDLYSGLGKYGKKLADEVKGFVNYMNKLEIDAGQLGKIPGNPFMFDKDNGFRMVKGGQTIALPLIGGSLPTDETSENRCIENLASLWVDYQTSLGVEDDDKKAKPVILYLETAIGNMVKKLAKDYKGNGTAEAFAKELQALAARVERLKIKDAA